MPEYPEGINPETGLIEDIDEIRKLGLGLASQIILLINHPLLSLLIPQGVKLDLALMAVTARSLMHPTSQATYYRELGEAIGMAPREIERAIRAFGLSETLPITHPDAPTIALREKINPSDPLVRSSLVLGRVADMQAKARGGGSGDRAREEEVTGKGTELSADIENFLSDLLKKKE